MNILLMKNKIKIRQCIIAIIGGVIFSGILSFLLNMIWFDVEGSKSAQKYFLTELRRMEITGIVSDYTLEKEVKFLPFQKKAQLNLVIENSGDLEEVLRTNNWHIYKGDAGTYIKDNVCLSFKKINGNNYMINMKFLQ